MGAPTLENPKVSTDQLSSLYMISFQRGNDNERYLNFKMLIIIGMNFTALLYYFRFNQFILKSIFYFLNLLKQPKRFLKIL